MRGFTVLAVLGLLVAWAPAATTPWTEDFNTTADWFPGTEDPVDPGLNGYWDVERVSEPTGGGSTGYYYGGKLGDNGHNTPDGSWSLYNNANGYGGDYSNCRNLLWIEETFAQADVTGFSMDYKSRRVDLTDIHAAVRVGGQWYITEDHLTDTRGDRDLPYLSGSISLGAWRTLTLDRLDVNDLGQNCNAYGPQDFAHQNNPGNLAWGDTTVALPAGDIDAVGVFVASGTHVDGEYVENSRATFYADNFTVVPEPATMALLGLGGLGALVRRRSRKA